MSQLKLVADKLINCSLGFVIRQGFNFASPLPRPTCLMTSGSDQNQTSSSSIGIQICLLMLPTSEVDFSRVFRSFSSSLRALFCGLRSKSWTMIKALQPSLDIALSFADSFLFKVLQPLDAHGFGFVFVPSTRCIIFRTVSQSVASSAIRAIKQLLTKNTTIKPVA